MIKKFVQGDKKTDDKLFCLIGRPALDTKIHAELGVPITGNTGDIWWLWLDEQANLFGFCEVRISKDKHWHIRFLYADKLGIKIKNELLNRVLSEAHEQECPLVFTNDRDTAGIWNLFNFVPGDKKRGAFVRWEKVL